MKLAVLISIFVVLAAFPTVAQSTDKQSSKISDGTTKSSFIAFEVTIVDAPDEQEAAISRVMCSLPGADARLGLLVLHEANMGKAITVYRGLKAIIPSAAQSDKIRQEDSTSPKPIVIEKTFIVPAHYAPPIPEGRGKPVEKQKQVTPQSFGQQAALGGGPVGFLPPVPYSDIGHPEIFLHETLTVTAHLGPGGTIPINYDISERPLTVTGQACMGLYGFSSGGGGGYDIFYNYNTKCLERNEIPGGRVHLVFATVTVLPPTKD